MIFIIGLLPELSFIRTTDGTALAPPRATIKGIEAATHLGT
jgi:hypothetical protein